MTTQTRNLLNKHRDAVQESWNELREHARALPVKAEEREMLLIQVCPNLFDAIALLDITLK